MTFDEWFAKKYPGAGMAMRLVSQEAWDAAVRTRPEASFSQEKYEEIFNRAIEAAALLFDTMPAQALYSATGIGQAIRGMKFPERAPQERSE